MSKRILTWRAIRRCLEIVFDVDLSAFGDDDRRAVEHAREHRPFVVKRAGYSLYVRGVHAQALGEDALDGVFDGEIEGRPVRFHFTRGRIMTLEGRPA